MREGVEGFVAGYNRYLRDVGVAGILDARCTRATLSARRL